MAQSGVGIGERARATSPRREIRRMGPKTGPYDRSPVPSQVREAAHTCEFRGVLQRVPKIADWLAERGRFEPPRPLRIRWAEFNPSLAHYSARIRASMLERIVRLDSALLGVVRAPESDPLGPFWAYSADFSPRRGDSGPFAMPAPISPLNRRPPNMRPRKSALKHQLCDLRHSLSGEPRPPAFEYSKLPLA